MPDPSVPATSIAPLPWMTDPATRAVLTALGAEHARFAGGPVRDALLQREVVDIDIATTWPPEETMRRLAAAGIAVVPTGLAHGTVTAVVKPRSFEITTLRRDVETFGRHARVAFTEDWAADAARRDFTMNALYLDAQGNVFDFVDGLADLYAHRVRFVGDAEARIREDVLRLLRFYRFHAHYGDGEADEAARAAARALHPLLPRLSAERVAGELKKLLLAPDPVPTLALMREDGVLAEVLPEAGDLARLAVLVPLEPAPDAIRRLAALVIGRNAEAIARRLKFKTSERERLAALAASSPIALDGDDKTQRRALYRLGPALYGDHVLLAAAETGAAPSPRALLALAADWHAPRFPVKGQDAVARGVAAGPEVGALLAALEAWWEAGDFIADRKTCLAELERRIAGPDG